MEETIYGININVEGAPSGSERLGNQQGQTRQKTQPEDIEKRKIVKARSAVDITRELIGEARFNQLTKAAGATGTIGAASLSIYKQNATFRGDSNTVAQVNEYEKWGGKALTATALVGTGNYIGAGLYIGYTAYGLAKENRQLLNEREIDTYKNNYYQQRLVTDVSKRSR